MKDNKAKIREALAPLYKVSAKELGPKNQKLFVAIIRALEKLAGLGILLLILSACGGQHKEMPDVQTLVKECGPDCTLVAGALHFDPATREFFILDNGDHDPVGIDHVVTYQDHIEVFYSEYQDIVVLADAHEDDAYAATGIHFGTSGRNASMVIAWTDGKTLADMDVPGCAIWLFAIGKKKK